MGDYFHFCVRMKHVLLSFNVCTRLFVFFLNIQGYPAKDSKWVSDVLDCQIAIMLSAYYQSVHIRPWKIISRHNIASGPNIKKSKYNVWTKYFDWKQTLLGSNLQIVPWRNIVSWRNIFHGRYWSDCEIDAKEYWKTLNRSALKLRWIGVDIQQKVIHLFTCLQALSFSCPPKFVNCNQRAPCHLFA